MLEIIYKAMKDQIVIKTVCFVQGNNNQTKGCLCNKQMREKMMLSQRGKSGGHCLDTVSRLGGEGLVEVMGLSRHGAKGGGALVCEVNSLNPTPRLGVLVCSYRSSLKEKSCTLVFTKSVPLESQQNNACFLQK